MGVSDPPYGTIIATPTCASVSTPHSSTLAIGVGIDDHAWVDGHCAVYTGADVPPHQDFFPHLSGAIVFDAVFPDALPGHPGSIDMHDVYLWVHEGYGSNPADYFSINYGVDFYSADGTTWLGNPGAGGTAVPGGAESTKRLSFSAGEWVATTAAPFRVRVVLTSDFAAHPDWDFEFGSALWTNNWFYSIPFYNQTEQQWGFAHVPTTSPDWWQFAPVPGTVPDPGWISALTCDQNNADKLYAIWQNDRYLRISTNAGVSWTSSVLFPSEPSPVPPPIVYSIQARGGQVFLFNHQASDSSNRGIWRSTNDGATWTQLTDRPNSGYMSLASTKLWYAEQDASGEIDFKRMNLDGSSIETLGHEPTYGGRLLVRALSDDLCLFTSRGNAQIHRVQPSGSVQICPSSFVPWDAVPLSPTVFMAVGTATLSSTDVLVQRTVNAGSSWTVVKTITSLEGFALNGTTDSYFMIDAATPARTDLVMTGHASSTVQQNFWISSDAGLTWTKILNEAEPPGWSVINPGGVVARPAVQPIVSIPSRLATIVG